MRFQLAPIIATPLASFLFLFGACAPPVYAQDRTVPQESQSRERGPERGPGCSLMGVEISFNPDEGVSRFFATDNFHWVQVWVDYRAQMENHTLQPTLYVTQRYDFVQTQCDRDTLKLYDYSRNVTVLFELDRMRWTFWQGLPVEHPQTANYHDIQHILLQPRNLQPRTQ